MANVNAVYTKSLSALEVAQTLSAVAIDVFGNDRIQFYVNGPLGLTLHFDTRTTPFKEHPELKSLLERLSQRPDLPCTSARVQLSGNSEVFLNYQNEGGIYGKIEFSWPGDYQRTINALDAVRRHFTVVPYVDLVRGYDSAPEKTALQIRERSLAELQTAVDRLGTYLTDMAAKEVEARRQVQADLDREYNERRAALDKQHADAQAALDAEQRRLKEAHEARVQEHEERVKQFETQESKYVRRELLKRIEEVLDKTQTMSLSESTARKRWWVHGFAGLLMTISGLTAYNYQHAFFSSGDHDWKLLVPMIAASVTLVSTLVYYLKWNDRWFREHADGEFAAKRYKADILRASWIAELVAEAATDESRELPPQLLEAYTRNLFQGDNTSVLSEHPVDSLTSLMKRANEVSIGPEAVTVKASPSRSLKKIA